MPQRTVKFPEKLFRTAIINRETIKEDDRTVEISFSSEEPVERYFGIEILDHAPKSVRLERIRTAGPALFNHDRNAHIGRVESAEISAKRGKAVIRFSKSALGNEKFQDVKDGILREVSVGYAYYKAVLEEERDGVSTYRITDWEPLEISFVTIPADISVGAGRDRNTTEIELPVEGLTTRTQPISNMPPETVTTPAAPAAPAPAAASATVVAETRTAETTRIREIAALGTQFADRGVTQDEVNAYIRDGKSVDDFRAYILTEKFKAKAETRANPAAVGMNPKEVKRYSLVRAMNKMANREKLDGLEAEVSQQVATNLRREAEGFFIPFEIANARNMVKRDLSASVAGAGGYLVQDTVDGANMIELLRANMVLAKLGARTMGGLVGNVAIPRQSGGATAYWLAEGASAPKSDQAFEQLGLTPRRLAAVTAYTKQLLIQASVDVESLVREDLMAVLGLAKDKAGLQGAGGAEPLGIVNTPNVNTITFGGAQVWADWVQAWRKVLESNALLGNLAYLTSAAAIEKGLTIERATNTAQFIIKDDLTVLGKPVEYSNQLSGDKLIFGNWNDVIIADWEGWDVVVDPYTLAADNKVRVVVNTHTDIGIRHAKSFTVSTDSAAQ